MFGALASTALTQSALSGMGSSRQSSGLAADNPLLKMIQDSAAGGADGIQMLCDALRNSGVPELAAMADQLEQMTQSTDVSSQGDIQSMLMSLQQMLLGGGMQGGGMGGMGSAGMSLAGAGIVF